MQQIARSIVALTGAAAVFTGAAAFAQTLVTPHFTAAQAARGETAYAAECAACHGENLDDGPMGFPLKGPVFWDKWSAGNLEAVHDLTVRTMPVTNPGGLSAQAYADVLAYMLSKNGVAPSDKELPSSAEALKAMAAPSGR